MGCPNYGEEEGTIVGRFVYAGVQKVIPIFFFSSLENRYH
jgi:hypothetical protein